MTPATTELPTRLVEQLYVDDFSAHELRVLLVVIRWTYSQKEDFASIPMAVLSDLTGIGHSRTCKIVEKLTGHRILKRENGMLAINEQYVEWIPYDRQEAS